MSYRYRLAEFFLCLVLVFQCVGCREDIAERIDVEYEICDYTMLPEELWEIIEEKKDEKICLSYNNNEYTYIVVGFGLRQYDNYVVELKDIFRTDQACYISCSLYTSDFLNASNAYEEKTAVYTEPSINPILILRCKKLNMPIVYYVP